MKIFVIAHKPYKNKFENVPDIYVTLTVGVENGNKSNTGALKDNTDINISLKNQSYCELTGLYWIWKNYKDDVIGIDHYRRYFIKENNGKRKELINEDDVKKYLKKYDILVPKKYSFLNNKTVGQQFCYSHDPLVWSSIREIIKGKYPEYLNDFDEINYQNYEYLFNMLICRKELFDKYCEWLFSILFLLEPTVDLNRYNDYNKRMFGFAAERLFNIWIKHKKVKIKELPVAFTDKRSVNKRIKNKLKKIYNAIK
ncbi:DUF4422 domain-containing protein [Lactobacillus crispatus]|uniref:DUF4422 domain-containing protein n=1 Tax=Lactobacillus crispatus TaxID=47770 RepID=UPI00070903F4|nr:DUF4422 domain-containing protein [Lactobacillus crispatus]MBW9142364.1 DUF4422 domain-containing protein [Lactobacillus crispatus]ORE87705.1 hypothetical protein B6C82_01810 [Lactobacillus crispatus]QWW28780.1 DUF4422 domain-containing protein [Lactobacillus crispatus]